FKSGRSDWNTDDHDFCRRSGDCRLGQPLWRRSNGCLWCGQPGVKLYPVSCSVDCDCSFCVWCTSDWCRKIRFAEDRKSTRLNSSHVKISYAVFCLKKKKERDGKADGVK